MLLKVFSVFDNASEAYMQPFFMQTKGQAIRSFQDAVNSESHEFSKHAEDYTLFELGDYDDSNAQFNMYEAPRALGNAVEFLQIKTSK